MIKIVLAFILLPVCLLGQWPSGSSKFGPQNTYSTTVPTGTTLTNQPLVLTVSVPATNGYDGFFRSVTLTLPGSGLCEVTIERDGGAPSGGTGLTIQKENPGVMTASSRATHLQAFLGATTAGAVIARHLILLGVPQTIRLGEIRGTAFDGQWIANPTGTTGGVISTGNRTGFTARQQLTVRTCNVTGAPGGTVNWYEVQP